MDNTGFKIIFWGVRGSLPTPGPNTVVFGGNTSCVQVQIGEQLIILDAGSGMYNLGQDLLRSKNRITGDIFITHTHWDHIHGFPFFAPAFMKENRFVLYGQSKINLTFADLMRGQMMHPHFPVQLKEMGAHIDFVEIDSGDTIYLSSEIAISTMHNNHPNGSLSYRIDYGSRSCCYVSDTEHYSCIDPYLKSFIHNADLVIYDSNFTDEEYRGYDGFPPKVGWGHSTWQEGIKLVEAAGAKKLVLFHHAIHRTDHELKAIERQAQNQFADCLAAKEGMVISL